MKTYQKIISLITVNLLFCLCGLIANFQAYSMLKRTINFDPNISGIIILMMAIFIGVFAFIKKLSKFSIGLGILTANLLIFLFFWANQQFSTPDHTQNIKLTEAYSFENNHFVSIAPNRYVITYKVPLENCLQADSILASVNKGLFNILTVDKLIGFEESKTCLDLVPPHLSYLEKGHEYAKKRCYTLALRAYSNALKDQNNYEAFYHIGLMYTATHKYNKALDSFQKGKKRLEEEQYLTDTKRYRLENFNQRINSLKTVLTAL